MTVGHVLRVLGGLAIERADGTSVSGRAAQKRRLALLALLGFAPGRCLSRDRLLAYLWPESDTEQARHLLAVAVYEMRKAFGEDAILSRGDELSLNPAVIALDSEVFEAAAQAGDWRGAVAAYSGAFLDGFHISDAADFERWADGERDRLARLFATALESYARASAAAGDAAAALEAWRRLAALEPYNARYARELMLALELAGDRAAALRHARVHATLLREEFGAEADPDVAALAERLRAAPAAATPSAAADGEGSASRTPPAAAAGEVSSSRTPSAAAAGEVSSSRTPSAAAAGEVSPPHTPSAASAEVRAAPVPSGDVSGAAPADPQSAPLEARRHAAAAPAYGPRGGDDGSGSVEAPQRVARAAWLRLRPARVLAVAGLLGIVIIAAITWTSRSEVYAFGCEGGSASIAVMPFMGIDVPDELSHFGDGLAEEILTGLSRIACLEVVPRTKAFEAQPGAGAARQLGVQYELRGTFRGYGGDSLRVNATLVNADGVVLWRQQYDRPWTMRHKLAVQEDIAQRTIDALPIEVVSAAKRSLVRSLGSSLVAYDRLYEGRRHLARRTIPDLQRAEQLFEQARELDPKLADAHASLAEVKALLGAYDYGLRDPAVAYPEAMAAAERALALDSLMGDAHATRGSVYFNYHYDWKRAEAAFLRAIELKPGYTQSYHWYSLMLAALGRPVEAQRQIDLALQLDGESILLQTALARHHYFARRFERAVSEYETALDMDPQFVTGHMGLGMSYVQLGRTEEAIASFSRAQELLPRPAPVIQALLGHAHARSGHEAAARASLAWLAEARRHGYVPAEYFALVHVGMGDHDAAVDALEQAFRNRSGGVAYLNAEPILDPLRAHPRFIELRRKAGL